MNDKEILIKILDICVDILDIVHPCYSSKPYKGNKKEKETRIRINDLKSTIERLNR